MFLKVNISASVEVVTDQNIKHLVVCGTFTFFVLLQLPLNDSDGDLSALRSDWLSCSVLHTGVGDVVRAGFELNSRHLVTVKPHQADCPGTRAPRSRMGVRLAQLRL